MCAKGLYISQSIQQNDETIADMEPMHHWEEPFMRGQQQNKDNKKRLEGKKMNFLCTD